MLDFETWVKSNFGTYSRKSVLAISPHLDDAALSIGATLSRLVDHNVKVSVLTVFAGIPKPPYTPTANLLHDMWNLKERPVESRRAEDVNAMKEIGAEALHDEFLDSPYRSSNTITSNSIKVNIDHSLTRRIYKNMCKYIDLIKPSFVLSCAAVGHHQDHRHTRDAALLVMQQIGIRLLLWEDIPYSLRASISPDLPRNLSLGNTIVSTPHSVSWNRKYQAIECYQSQQEMLWQGSDFRTLLDRHAYAQSRNFDFNDRAEIFWDIRNIHRTRAMD